MPAMRFPKLQGSVGSLALKCTSIPPPLVPFSTVHSPLNSHTHTHVESRHNGGESTSPSTQLPDAAGQIRLITQTETNPPLLLHDSLAPLQPQPRQPPPLPALPEIHGGNPHIIDRCTRGRRRSSRTSTPRQCGPGFPPESLVLHPGPIGTYDAGDSESQLESEAFGRGLESEGISGGARGWGSRRRRV
ncbi:hypothetical protein BDY17DRAFT_28367 [Neohortaea acidophila]|uniref:Uncharacterized protein n=1 Tax=Neohortaea acidophila TaxID=245834 RepID=A0A6A6PIP0_9PEZI|nr:uncharacterized protein BDY17DRAFT_28367 [Neohortaea acidophila]KAF2479908.1 hypothetical protein BDY17DRAFT_28367 [Neohortaea acidophila]